MYSNILLIGFPGSGKSHIGKLYSEKYNIKWIDTDKLIEKKYNNSLINILNQFGEEEFCNIEAQIILSLSCINTIISPGGSIIYNAKAMDYLLYTLECKVIFLDPPYEVICKRLGDWKSRGIVIKPGNTLLNLYNQRYNLYKYYSYKQIKETDENKIITTIKTLI